MAHDEPTHDEPTLDESTQDLTSATESKGRFYRPELDALRFFAFFGVFVFHAFPHYQSFYSANAVAPWLNSVLIPTVISGAYGVDLFFALSAYLITGLLLRERAATGTLDLRGFYLRRILRIWPLYLSFVAFAALLSVVSPAHKLGWHYVAGYTLLAGNWVYVVYGLPGGFTIPLWTVSIEEQFYLTWPLAVRHATVRGMAWIAVGVLVLANAMRIWLAVTGASLQAMEYNTFTRLDPIALGILLALFVHNLPRLAGWQRATLAMSGVAALVGSAAFNGWHSAENPETWRLAITHPLIALGSAAILFAFIRAESRWLRNPALIYLGKISYGLYVVHVLGLYIAARLIQPVTISAVAVQSVVGFVITVAIAAASYRWLETPFLKLKERFAHVQSRPV